MEVPSGSEGILVVAALLMSMTDAVTSLLLYITRAGGRYRIQRFGRLLGTALYAFRLVDTDALQRSHWDINFWTDAEVLAWKNSHIEACNAIAVAVRFSTVSWLSTYSIITGSNLCKCRAHGSPVA
jgi:hypothetical protein